MSSLQTPFPKSEGSEIENVVAFLEEVPTFLFGLTDEKNSNFGDILKEEEEYENITQYFRDVKDEFKDSIFAREVTALRRKINISKISDNVNAEEAFAELSKEYALKLEPVGFTGSSLKLKKELVNSLWQKVKTLSPNKINVRDNWVKKLLELLRSMLGSLSIVFPALEAINEILDIIKTISS